MVPQDSGPLFAAAAAALSAGIGPADQPPAVRALVTAFDLTGADAPLLRLAAAIGTIFRLPAPEAPGLAVFGATLDLSAAAGEPPGTLPPASASGVGETAGAALRACLGEAAELLASVETAADRAAMRAARPRGAPPDRTLARLLAGLPWPQRRMRSLWHAATRLTDGATLWLPRELVFRTPPERRAFPPPWPLSLGCGAGPTPEQAALHGLLELIERDAAALWWRGGMPARAIALGHPAQQRAGALLARLRRGYEGRGYEGRGYEGRGYEGRGREGRRSWLLDITSDLGVATVAAVSVEADGRGFCCGIAARAGGLAPAAEAAVLEMAQMELGQALAVHKAAQRGAAALNPRDAAHLARRTGIDAASCPLIHPARPPGLDLALAAEGAPADLAMAALVTRLAAHGLAPIRLDHARPRADGIPVCIPVMRMLCPGLDLEMMTGGGPRLREAIARTGGGVPFRDGIGLA